MLSVVVVIVVVVVVVVVVGSSGIDTAGKRGQGQMFRKHTTLIGLKV